MFDPKTIDRASLKLNEELRLKRNETLWFAIPFALILSIVLSIILFLLSLFSGETVSKALEYAGGAALAGLFNGLFWTYITEGRSYRHRKRIIKNGKKYLDKIERLIEYNLPFILYLYDFNSGTDSIMYKGPPVAGTSGESFIDGNHRREIISRKLHKFIPVVYLYNSRETNYRYQGYALIVEDENWFESFQILYQHARYVVIDYKTSFKSSSNITSEVKYIIEQNVNKILFSGTNNEFRSLKALYPKIAERIIGSFKMTDLPSRNEAFYGKNISGRYITVDESDKLFDIIKSQKI